MHFEFKRLFFTPFGRVGKVALLLVVLGLATSCSKKNGDEKASQTVARVNGEEITVYQVNNELQRANVQADQQNEAAIKVASALVDRQILKQAAHKTRVDRKPHVMQAIENAKTQILAQAYIEDKVTTLAKPTEAEISDYRAKHADIFANRKIFVMDEIAFKVEAANVQEIQALSSTAKTLQDVAHWLDAHQIRYSNKQASHAAETLPSQLLGKLASMAVGDLIFINANGGTVVARMMEIKSAAIADNDSKSLIERMIFDQKRKQMVEDEVKRLRAEAKIEYINKKFEPTVASLTANPAETAQVAERVNAVENSKAEANIEKGLSGL